MKKIDKPTEEQIDEAIKLSYLKKYQHPYGCNCRDQSKCKLGDPVYRLIAKKVGISKRCAEYYIKKQNVEDYKKRFERRKKIIEASFLEENIHQDGPYMGRYKISKISKDTGFGMSTISMMLNSLTEDEKAKYKEAFGM